MPGERGGYNPAEDLTKIKGPFKAEGHPHTGRFAPELPALAENGSDTDNDLTKIKGPFKAEGHPHKTPDLQE